jgi:hypothetical protein
MATVNILGLNTISDIQMVYVDNDPSDPSNTLALPDGSEFPQGSMAWANISGAGTVYLKAAAAGGGLTGWKRLDVSDNDWALAGNALAGGEVLGSTNAQDVSMVRNNALRLKLMADGLHFGSIAGSTDFDAVSRAIQDAAGQNLFGLDYLDGDGTDRPFVIERGNVKQIISTGSPATDTIFTFTPAADTIINMEADVLVKSMAGGTSGEVSFYKRSVTARNIGGTVTIRQTAALVTHEDSAAPQHDLTSDVNSGVIRLRGTQQSNKTMNWFTKARIQVYKQ